jgi:ketosteroid isomerase-like protein
MAVSDRKRVLHLPVNGDTVSGRQVVQAFWATGAVTVKNGAGEIIWVTTAEGDISFGCGLQVDGIEKDAGAGQLYVYLK